MDFQELRRRKQALAKLRDLSDFEDDGYFIVRLDGDLPLEVLVRAPSLSVLEHACYRAGLDGIPFHIIPQNRREQ